MLLAGVVLFCSLTLSATAQRIALRTNGLLWATTTPNAGLDVRLSRYYTLTLEGAVNPFSVGNYKMHVVGLAPELRYWPTARPGAGHFFGVAAEAGAFDLQLNKRMLKGHAIGGGLTYGYSIPLADRWNIEGSVTLGALRMKYKNYRRNQQEPSVVQPRTLVGPIKAGIHIVYILK